MNERNRKRAVEMTGYGKRGKPKAGFPRFPQPLEIAKSAIPTFPQPRRRPRGKVEIQNQDSHFPIAAFLVLPKLRKEDSPKRRFPSFRLIVRLEYAVLKGTEGQVGDLPHESSYAGRAGSGPADRFQSRVQRRLVPGAQLAHASLESCMTNLEQSTSAKFDLVVGAIHDLDNRLSRL
jgi:hypothetical protein